MIKLKNILRESKARGILSEAFRSSILRKMTNNFTGLDKDFLATQQNTVFNGTR